MSSDTPSSSKSSDEEADTAKRVSESLDPSDDNCCSICIDEIKEMCYTDTCLHRFCFTCLSEWVKRKHICPMCKADFTSIIHNIVEEILRINIIHAQMKEMYCYCDVFLF